MVLIGNMKGKQIVSLIAGIDTCEMNLRFIDYLGNAGWEDKVIYYLFRYHKCYAVRIFLLMCKIGRKLIRKIV